MKIRNITCYSIHCTFSRRNESIDMSNSIGSRLKGIVILEKDNNRKGDLFGRLMGDFFHAIGYDEPKHNIPKAGRELDMATVHRTEKKIAIAEFKAQQAEVGGSDINKFIGALDAEKRKYKKNKEFKSHTIVGYFIALSGFKSSALEQELETHNNRVILVDSKKIVDELVSGKIIVSLEKAIGNVPAIPSHLSLNDEVNLFAYENGWVWGIYYSTDNITTHFALVHAEGRPLVQELAEIIINLDNQLGGSLVSLTYLQPQSTQEVIVKQLDSAKGKYFEYLKNECGEIHFEGLPTDKDAGSVKVNLENIFVPPHLEQISQFEDEDGHIESKGREEIGVSIRKYNKIAILAKPGGGKSTLIKRLAIAYAFPERRVLISDSLPNENWFPIFIRCRELGANVTSSITQIIESIPNRAEISYCSNEFAIIASEALQKGKALLLIDGLDEISDDKDRISFVSQLRTFLATYPQVNIVVTSREAGFRVVGGSLANYCAHYKLSSLDNKEIEELTIKWHKAIIDDSDNTIKEAKILFKLIISDSRIKVLAENPLLLTTLLFVKRWAGYLPTKKSVLYQEMIKLLLVTWNVEGHEQLDIEEAEPQLAYVAFWMTKAGQQTITVDELKDCLLAARRQMPDILKFTKVSVPNFIKRVESRSSLLIMSGHKKMENGAITPIYEFLHLSFQEYLTAKAIVEKYLPEHDAEKTNLEIIKPFLYKENWKEISPLVAALAKRSTRELRELIVFLIEESKNTKDSAEFRDGRIVLPSEVLGNCIANEIQINPELLEQAIEWFGKNYFNRTAANTARLLLKSKFNDLFTQKITSTLFDVYEDLYAPRLGELMGELYQMQRENLTYPRLLRSITSDIVSSDKITRCSATLALMEVAFEVATSKTSKARLSLLKNVSFNQVIELFHKDLCHEDEHYIFTESWCLAWMERAGLLNDDDRKKLTPVLIGHWIRLEKPNLTRLVSWALSHIIRPNFIIQASNFEDIQDKIKSKYKLSKNEYDKFSSVFVGHAIGISFDKKEVNQLFSNRGEWMSTSKTSNIGDYSRALGINRAKVGNE